MPASSRKRNKGRERKAKQLAKKEENDREFANKFWRELCCSSVCDHGYELVIPSDDHPVSSFMNQFIINAHHKGMTVQQNLRDTSETHTQTLNNEHYKTLVGILVRIGTNMLLQEEVCDLSWSVCIAHCIVFLEHYNGTVDIDSVINSRVVRSKWRDLRTKTSSSSGRRDALKFYRKRTSCKCLKMMHLEARKTMPKTGKCHNCDKQIERALLSLCSRCMISQYCSRECQVAAWPEHEGNCDEYVRNREEQTKNE